MKKRKRLSSKFLFLSFLLALGVTILTVFITGLDIHRSLYYNTLITLSITTGSFIVFLTAGLYLGFEMEDTLRDYEWSKKSKFPENVSGEGFFDGAEVAAEMGADGIEGCLFGILIWIFATVGFAGLMFLFETIIPATILLFAGALYWIFFRAIGFVLSHANECEDKFWKSLGIATFYSILYSGWIYGIVVGVHYLE